MFEALDEEATGLLDFATVEGRLAFPDGVEEEPEDGVVAEADGANAAVVGVASGAKTVTLAKFPSAPLSQRQQREAVGKWLTDALALLKSLRSL